MRKPTLGDVAQQAGVSYATADRVLNGRAKVSEKTAKKVRTAVHELQYERNVAAANLSRQRVYRFVFVLPAGQNAFFKHVREIIAAKAVGAARLAISLEIQEAPAFDAPGLGAHLDALATQPIDGIAVVGLEDDALLAPLNRLSEIGIPVVSLVSSLPTLAQNTYIGIDNVMAGRTAGRLAGMAHTGRVGCAQVIVGGLNARDHIERLNGFQQVIEADFPNIEIRPVILGRDDAETVYAQTLTALAVNPQITAIYNVGAGNSGLGQALAGVPQRPFCIVHELVAHSRSALENNLFDIVIDQRPEEEITAALDLLRLLSDRLPLPPHDLILPTIFVRDNLPPRPPQTINQN